MSWNVAGLATTLSRIHEAYGSRDDKACGQSAWELFLKLHGVDILCIQEHKISWSQLSNRSEPFRCASIDGYDSFWSKSTSSGMNGVVTFARKGLTKSANATPLGCHELDSQGRCIQTDHGAFVLFNVYAPCNGGHSVRSKMTFLHALRRAMKKCEKPVVLVGDLNVAHRGIDKYWKDRCLVVDDITQDKTEPWKLDVANSWGRILETLQTKKEVETETTNSLTGMKFRKYRLLCTLPGNRHVFLGKHESKREYCEWQYDFSEARFICPDSKEEKIIRKANTVSIAILAELLAKICNVIWNEETQRRIAESVGGVCEEDPSRRWLNQLLDDDYMVDVFRHFYPTAQDRYTCWNQATNRRYENEGARIDYILVHRSLLHKVLQGESGLRSSDSCLDPLSSRAALCAATANGAYKPVSFEGDGIPAVPKAVLDTQFGPPHTGLIYTPPSFSDHIGVCMMLDSVGWDMKLTIQGDTQTRRAQPHRSQQSIESFLTSKRPVGDTNVDAGVSSKRPTPRKNKPNTILHHFGVRNA